MRHRLIAFLFAAICAACAFGQSSNCGGAGYAAAQPFSATPGAPYSGEAIEEQVRTLADGAHITRKWPITKVYRDSLGRMRTERTFRGGGSNCASAIVVEISDPVAGYQYTFALDTVSKVTHRQRLPLLMQKPAREQDQATIEKLGTRTIEGVLAEGVRMTKILQVDSVDNDRPISILDEAWTAVTLKVAVLSRHNDPRNGESTQKLVNISEAEPDAGLFQPPRDYSVADEPGGFAITWGFER